MSGEIFGHTEAGEEVLRLRISGGGLTASVMTWGAAIQDLRLEGHAHPLVLGFETFEAYPAHSPYFGAIVGRYANRIGHGRFTLDGKTHQLDTNFLGKHMLHGGSGGFGKRVWTVTDHGESHVTLEYRSGNGEMGFPGALTATCTYRTLPEGRLVLELSAETDAPTLCNIAHHSYFNLEDGGRGWIRDHEMQIEAGAYLPVDQELIPTGDVVSVEGTAFDFRTTRRIEDGAGTAYDHNFCLSAARMEPRRVVHARGPKSGVEMDVWTSEPGVQFYDGARTTMPVPGLEGIEYGAHAGFCLEPQTWPDSPNRPYFPQAVLRPGETYRQTTEYRFQRG